MRLRNLIPVAATATTLLALAPAGALAHRHPSLNGTCRLTLEAAPHRIAAGDSVLAFGVLTCGNGASVAGQTVQLFEHPFGTPGFKLVQSTTTDPHGFYEMTQADVLTNSAFFVRAGGAQSGGRHVLVEAQVTLSGPPAGTMLFTGAHNEVTFTGTVNPADAGARVILQRQNALTGNEWHRIDTGMVGPEGGFTIVHRFLVPGDANIRALVRSQGRNVPGVSNELTYEISQAENPRLTINASADPIAFGQSVTISGVAAGHANQPVTLLARTVRQRGFAPVAQTTTNGAGEYTFPPQSPVNSTLYKVSARVGGKLTPGHAHTGGKGRGRGILVVGIGRGRGASARGLSSAVLYEGVKDVLTAAVSASTVQAGQTVTFTGTVAPDHTGHIIYLERQDASGKGYHVVQVTTVGAGSAYAIVHKVYVPGTKVYRVRIPGGPENEGAASPPFTIQVTPAPASSLTPEGPGNSSQPEEGES